MHLGVGDRGRAGSRALAALVLAAASTSGCAFTSVTLTAPTPAEVTSASGDVVAKGREVLLIIPIADQRPYPDRCGVKKSGYGTVSAIITCATPPGQFLSELLSAELTAVGFKVVTDAAKATSAALRIEGVLSQFFAEPDVAPFSYSPEVDIELRLTASSESGLQAQRRLYVKARETAMSGLDRNFQIAANAAIKDMVARAAAAVLELVRTYPQLGLPAKEEFAAQAARLQVARR